MSAPVIETRGLSKSFGPQRVLDGVDLTVARGESLVVIGGSGTGKSVLLRTILGLEDADAGTVLLNGEPASPPVRARFMRGFGMLFQNAALFDSLPVWRNVAFRLLRTMPAPQARALLVSSDLDMPLMEDLASVYVAPCWTLTLAFPQAVRPGLTTLGPQWNAARSTHHRIAWLARESSKPQRSSVERWTVQASPEWSDEHLEDDAKRVQAKLLKAFAEVTGIRATPDHVHVKRWRYAQTIQALGRSHLWDAERSVGACGDWCLGNRVEDAFVSGLELALAVA